MKRTANELGRPRRRRARIGRTLALVAAASAIPAAGLTAPASAATQVYGVVCFAHSNGSAYQHTIYTQQWDSYSASWQNIESASSITACNAWTVPGYQYIRFVAQTKVGNVCWIAATDAVYTSLRANNFGVHVVTESRC